MEKLNVIKFSTFDENIFMDEEQDYPSFNLKKKGR